MAAQLSSPAISRSDSAHSTVRVVTAHGESHVQKNGVTLIKTDAHFTDLEFKDANAEGDFVELLARGSSPACCQNPGQPLELLFCAACSTDGGRGLCTECVNIHTAAFPMHTLGARLPSVAALSVPLDLLGSATPAMSAAPDGGAPPSDTKAGSNSAGSALTVIARVSDLVKTADRRVLAAQIELDILTDHEKTIDAVAAALTKGFKASVEAACAALRSDTAIKRRDIEARLLFDRTVHKEVLSAVATIVGASSAHVLDDTGNVMGAAAAAAVASMQSVASGAVGAHLSQRKEALRAELAGLEAVEEAEAGSVERAGDRRICSPVMILFFVAVLAVSLLLQMTWYIMTLPWRGY